MAKKQPQNTTTSLQERPPVVAVLGHIDHGKSTLLDYIRKSNVVEQEAGGITQHLSAYEVEHTTKEKKDRRITFLDTPGHEAFGKMRLRGAEIADIAILVVSAEEGVKAQTLEALGSIKQAGIPFIVALTKIDKAGADVERTKGNLLEKEIYLEGLGGDTPWVPVSGKTGEGIDELLDMVLLVADLAELKGDLSALGEGIVIEAHLDPQKGIAATLIIRNGTIQSGMCIVSGTAYSPVRIFEDYQGKPIKEATFSSPVRVIGWNEPPQVGSSFHTTQKKKEAEEEIKSFKSSSAPSSLPSSTDGQERKQLLVPLIVKADTLGSIDAIEHEIQKLESEHVSVKVIQKGAGAVSENDVKVALGSEGTLVVGFNVDIDGRARDLAQRSNVTVATFDIIYKLAEWLEEILKERTPAVETEETRGRAKILKRFSVVKDKHVLGARGESGILTLKEPVKIIRQEKEIGRGKITNLQQQKTNVQKIESGSEFGVQVQSAIDILPGDYLESFVITKR